MSPPQFDFNHDHYWTEFRDLVPKSDVLISNYRVEVGRYFDIRVREHV